MEKLCKYIINFIFWFFISLTTINIVLLFKTYISLEYQFQFDWSNTNALAIYQVDFAFRNTINNTKCNKSIKNKLNFRNKINNILILKSYNKFKIHGKMIAGFNILFFFLKIQKIVIELKTISIKLFLAWNYLSGVISTSQESYFERYNIHFS